jgi:IclR family acetate operon transcriptional repressor
MGTPTNNSVLKAFTILNAFRDSDAWLSCTELSQRANMPIASGHRLLQTLEQVGAVIRGPQGRYKPSILLCSLSRKVSLETILPQVGRDLVRDLANAFNLTVHIGVLDSGMVMYAMKSAAPAAYPIQTKVGSKLEAYCSGLGKVLLSALSVEEFETFMLEGVLVPLTAHTITNGACLRAEMDRVRRDGFAVDDREAQLDIVCVAVPIFDNEHRVVAALSASDAVSRMTEARRMEICVALRICAEQIRSKMFPGSYSSSTAPRPKTRPEFFGVDGAGVAVGTRERQVMPVRPRAS